MKKYAFLFAIPFLCAYSASTLASTDNQNLFAQKKEKAPVHIANNRSWYISWGYNKDYWSHSDIHVSQPSLNNDFIVHNVSAGDWPGWDTGIFNKNFMTPQYNIRIGHYFNAAHTWGIELSFDHTKYNTNLNQIAHITGIINGQPVNQNSALTPQYFYYAMHNGANELMLNLVRRKPIYEMPRAKMQLAVIGKMGAGVMIPHPENTIFGQQSNVGPKAWGNYFGWNHGWWQLGGWTAGVEAGFQLTFHQRIYLEMTDKEAYASLSDIQVNQGTASQTVWLNELIGNLGVMF